MEKNPFLKRLMSDKTEDVVHSSTYARAQNENIGVASTESFSLRQEIDQNRQVVKRYRDSGIVNERRGREIGAKKYEVGDDKGIEGAKSLVQSSVRSSAKPLKQMPVQSSAKPLTQPPARKNPGIFR